MRIAVLIAGALMLSSCQKEKETPKPVVIVEQALTCNCATSREISAVDNMNGYADLVSECTGNTIRIFREEMIEASIYVDPETIKVRYCLDRNW